MLPLLAFVIGVAGGLRSMSAPAAITWAAHLGYLRLTGSPLAFFALPAVRWLFTALAVGEWIADKLPFTPSRKAPLGLSARFITGAACGLAVCLGIGPVSSVTMALCVAAGLLGAATGTFGGYEFRRRLVHATGGRDLPIALLEDVIAAALLCAALYGLAHQAPVQTQVFYDVL